MQDTQRRPLISVVIPARNEAKNLYHVLPSIPAIVDEVILIDGASTDDTIEVAQRLLANIRIIRQLDTGKGAALRAGFAASNGDIIVMLDADGSTNPQEIPLFVAGLMQGFDFAKGSRFLMGGGSSDITFVRRLGNNFLCGLVNLLFGTNFSDLCYGYNAFWRHCLERLNVDCTGFEVETQLNLHAHKNELKVIEIPSFEHERIWGESKLRPFSDGWRVLCTIIKERSNNKPQLRYNQSAALYPVTETKPTLPIL